MFEDLRVSRPRTSKCVLEDFTSAKEFIALSNVYSFSRFVLGNPNQVEKKSRTRTINRYYINWAFKKGQYYRRMFGLTLNVLGVSTQHHQEVFDFLRLKFTSNQNIFSKQSSTLEIIGLATCLTYNNDDISCEAKRFKKSSSW